MVYLVHCGKLVSINVLDPHSSMPNDIIFCCCYHLHILLVPGDVMSPVPLPPYPVSIDSIITNVCSVWQYPTIINPVFDAIEAISTQCQEQVTAAQVMDEKVIQVS